MIKNIEIAYVILGALYTNYRKKYTFEDISAIVTKHFEGSVTPQDVSKVVGYLVGCHDMVELEEVVIDGKNKYVIHILSEVRAMSRYGEIINLTRNLLSVEYKEGLTAKSLIYMVKYRMNDMITILEIENAIDDLIYEEEVVEYNVMIGYENLRILRFEEVQ